MPESLPLPVGDISAAMFGAHAILAALFRGERTGKGGVVDVAMLAYQATRFFATRSSLTRMSSAVGCSCGSTTRSLVS